MPLWRPIIDGVVPVSWPWEQVGSRLLLVQGPESAEDEVQGVVRAAVERGVLVQEAPACSV